jgi:hypothetical protein
LALADVAALETSLFLGYSFRVFLLQWFPNHFVPANYRGLTLGVLVIPIVFLVSGYYHDRTSPVNWLQYRVRTILLMFGAFVCWDWLVIGHRWSRGIVLGTALISLAIVPICERFVRHRPDSGQ